MSSPSKYKDGNVTFVQFDTVPSGEKALIGQTLIHRQTGGPPLAFETIGIDGWLPLGVQAIP